MKQRRNGQVNMLYTIIRNLVMEEIGNRFHNVNFALTVAGFSHTLSSREFLLLDYERTVVSKVFLSSELQLMTYGTDEDVWGILGNQDLFP